MVHRLQIDRSGLFSPFLCPIVLLEENGKIGLVEVDFRYRCHKSDSPLAPVK